MQGLSCNSGLLCMYSVEEAIDVLAEVGYQAIDIGLEVAPPFLPIPEPHMSPQADFWTAEGVREQEPDLLADPQWLTLFIGWPGQGWTPHRRRKVCNTWLTICRCAPTGT